MMVGDAVHDNEGKSDFFSASIVWLSSRDLPGQQGALQFMQSGLGGNVVFVFIARNPRGREAFCQLLCISLRMTENNRWLAFGKLMDDMWHLFVKLAPKLRNQ